MNFLKNGNLVDTLAAAPKLLLMFDFDGTLSQIVSEPQAAVIDEDIECVIRKLESLQDTEVWIISGRDLNDLSGRVPFKNLIGSHGLECPFIFESLSTDEIRKIENKLRNVFSMCDGILIESKKYSVSVHFRNYAGDIEEIKSIVKKEGKNFQVTEGKKVIEIRIPGRNKGDVCLELIKRNPGYVSFYAGDDTTDEDAFRALENISITIKVGEGDTSAHYRTPSVSSLKDILAELWEKRCNG